MLYYRLPQCSVRQNPGEAAMPQFRIHLISEPVSAYEFEDPRSLKEFGYTT